MSSPIVLVTGAPGSGKTLWTIPEVEQLRTTTGRPAFYWRIPELTLGWTELLDAKDWHQLETGSIVVIDEAHKVFPQRPAGSQAPAHVAPFDELRHRGHTVFLITQHPGELDHYIRRRVGRHIHFERRFGLARSRRIEWQRLAEDLTDRRDAISAEFRFNPSTYSLYKSADVHTVTAKPPWGKFAGIAAAALVSLCAFIYAISFFAKPDKPSSTESLRDSRRLLHLRRWSHDESIEVFPGGPGARCPYGVGARGGVRIAVGGDRIDSGQDRLYGRDAAALGEARRA